MAKATARTRQLIKQRTKLEWLLLILLAIVIYLLLAALKDWWPSNTNNPNLGTAFYSTQQAIEDGNAKVVPNTDNGGSGGSNNGGGSGGGGNNNGGGSGGGSNSPLLTFAAGVDAGNSKQEVSGQANGLSESCAVVANVTSLGKQEVCTYREGDKIVTVTYLNDQVISASRSGF